MVDEHLPQSVRVDVLDPGPWTPPEAAALVLTAGVLLRDIALGEVVMTELLGPGELVISRHGRDAPLDPDVRFTVTEPATVAVISEAQLAATPALAADLAHAAADQLRRTAQHAALCRLPRVEERVLALFWHLAERWGRVAPEGMLVPLHLTQATLGRLVGARRPTVSLALKQLAADGRVTQRADHGWVLAAEGLADLVVPVDRRGALAP